MGLPTSAGHQRKHFARQRKSSGMRPTQNGAPHEKPFCFGVRASWQSNSSTLAHSTLGRSATCEKAILPEASVRPPGHPTPTAMLYNSMSWAVRSATGMKLPTAVHPYLKTWRRTPGLHGVGPMRSGFVQWNQLTPRSRQQSMASPHGPALARQPDRRKTRLLRACGNRHGILRDIKATSLQTAADVCRPSRPGDRQQTALLQGLVRGGQPAAVIDPRAIVEIHRRRIEVQQNRMQHAGVTQQPRRPAIVFQDHTRIMIQRALGKMRAMPIRHRRQRLGNDQRCTLLFELGAGGSQGMTQAKPREPKLRLPRRAKGRAGQPCHFLLHLTCRRSANLLTVDDKRFPAVVFLQGQHATLGQRGFGECDAWFHGGCGEQWRAERGL